MRERRLLILGIVAAACLTHAADAQRFDCALTDGSGLDAAIALGADTSGTLIGDWNADTNPVGTRTKPGLYGGFGSHENEPVDVAIGLSVEGDIDSAAAGSFGLSLDMPSGVLTLENLSADLLAGGPVGLPVTVGLHPDDFRTRQPDSIYLGLPIDLPIGEILLTSMRFVQTDGGATGVLVELDESRFSFALATLGELTVVAELLGTPIDIPPVPFPLALTGELQIAGDEIVITSVQAFDLQDVQNPGEALPELPLDLPTILPPGQIAHLLLNLVLDQVETTVSGELALSAAGQRVDCAADFNADGEVNTIDFIAFLGAWSAGEAEADINGDGTINTPDVIAFLNLWVAGC